MRYFVAVKTWRARRCLLRVLDKSDKHVDLTAEALEDLKASTKLSIDREDKGTYSFTAAEALVFGLTLRELVALTDTQGHTVIGDRPSNDHMTMRSKEDGEEAAFHAFVGDDAFLDLVG